MKKEIIDISTGIVLLLFSIVGLLLSRDLADPNSTGSYGPDFFPKLILTLLAILAVTLSVNAIKKYRGSKEYLDLNKKTILDILIFILILVGYILLFFATGFIISTVVFLFIGQWVFGIRKIPLIITTTIVLPIILFFIFSYFFKIPLP